ncbi:MAG: type I-E CRISPR-associated protein Cse2/CasB [Chloroflexota bacterium]
MSETTQSAVAVGRGGRRFGDTLRQARWFVAGLERLAKPEDAQGRDLPPDRAALAAMRRGLGREPGEAPEMLPHVASMLDRDVREVDEWAYYLVAALFAWHPLPWPQREEAGRRSSLGVSLARLSDRTESGSAERGMVALLNSHRDDLAERLRRAVGLLRSHEVPVDWTRLLYDLLRWDQLDRRVQRQWARDFWGAGGEQEAAPDAGAESTAGPIASSTN